MYSETCSVVSVQYYMSFVVHVKFILLIEEKEEKNTNISYIKFEEKKFSKWNITVMAMAIIALFKDHAHYPKVLAK